MTHLSVIKYFKKCSRKYAKCICSCGNIKSIRADHLNSGRIKSCGCLRLKNLTNRKFGLLVAIEYKFTKNKNAKWLCKCDCGNFKIVCISSLQRGNTKSCGCKSNDMRKASCMRKYGQNFAIQNDKCKKKREETNLKKYGVKNVIQNKNIIDKRKAACMKKYGVENPMQIPGVALRAARSNNKSFILKHWKTQEELVCVASYEKRVVEYLNKNRIDFKWQHKVFIMTLSSGRNTTYRPDLYIIGKRKPWVEIKGYFREDSREKWEIFHNKIKTNSELWNKAKLKAMGIL